MMSISTRATAGVRPRKPRPGEKCELCERMVEHPRNIARLRAFFAMLKPAFQNWPDRHMFQPHDTEDLRGWLLCKAGWCTVKRIEIGGTNRAQVILALSAFMQNNRGKKSEFRQTQNGIAAYTPKSISFGECREVDFRRIFNSCAEIIEAETGIKREKK